jgi:hypothetical protein
MDPIAPCNRDLSPSREEAIRAVLRVWVVLLALVGAPSRGGRPQLPLRAPAHYESQRRDGGVSAAEEGWTVWEPAADEERDVATAVLLHVAVQHAGQVFCVLRRVLVVEVEDGGELGQLSQTSAGRSEVMSESFRAFALRAGGLSDDTQFSLRVCRESKLSDSRAGERRAIGSLTFETIDVDGEAATAVVEWRFMFGMGGSNTRYSLRRVGGKWEVVTSHRLSVY